MMLSSRLRREASRVIRTALWALLVASIAAAANLAGIQAVGSVDGWQQWLQEHAVHFLAWRVVVYSATAYGWWWMRQRVLRRENTAEARRRVRRIEVAAVATILLLEIGQWLQQP